MADTAVNLAMFNEPFIEGEVTFDPAATASGPPPIPENKEGYPVKITFAEQDLNKQWNRKDENGRPKWLYTALVCEVLSGDYEGRKIRDGYVSTMVSPIDHTTAVNRICQALGQGVTADEVAQYGEHISQAKKLTDIVNAGVPAKIFVQWQAKWLVEVDGGKKEALTDDNDKPLMIRGASKSNWPKDDKGNPKTTFTLGEAFPEYAEAAEASLPARVDAVVTRYAPIV